MKNRNILFLNFTFNRKLRILQNADRVIQLRKKESDVLALLCEYYPNPVSQDDFLARVWGGGYVTSQSIAQVIRSLRLCLGDESKSIISTIPKLGYKFTITPIYEHEPKTKAHHVEVANVIYKDVDSSYAEQNNDVNSFSSSVSVIPYTQLHVKKRYFSTRNMILSSTLLIFLSLAGMLLNIDDVATDNINSVDLVVENDPPALVLKPQDYINDTHFVNVLENHAINN